MINNQYQKGIVLVSSLLLLLAITLVGVTSLRMNLSSEDMASSSYIRQRAEQGAEVALQYAERLIAINPNIHLRINPDCSYGICYPITHEESGATGKVAGQWVKTANYDVFEENSDKSREVPDAIKTTFDLSSSPRYIIEFLGHSPRIRDDNSLHNSACDKNGNKEADSGDVNSSWTTFPYCRLDPRLFRITSVGFAGPLNNQTRVMLQTTYVAK